MAENTVSVELTIEQTQALKSLGDLSKNLEKFAASAEKSTKQASGSINSFGKQVAAVFSGNLLAKFAEGAISALAGLPGALLDVAKAGAEAEAVNTRLANALALSGNASADTAESFDKLASSISELTGVDDEAVKAAAGFALTLGATDEQAKKIVKTAADLSAALGVDFNTAAQQLSLTLEGSSGKLGKVSNEVRGLGEQALRSGAAIDILAKQFGGLAAANAGSVEVQFKNLAVNIGNVTEELGKGVTGSVGFRAGLITINTTLVSFTKFLEENKSAISNFTTGLTDGFVTGLQVVAAFTDEIVRFGSFVKNIFEVGLGTIATGLNALDFSVSSVTNKIASFFGKEPDTQATEDAFNRLNVSINSVDEDLKDLQKTNDPNSYNVASDAVLGLSNAYQEASASIIAADTATQESRDKLAAQGIANRKAEQEARLAEEALFQEELNAVRASADLSYQEQQLQLANQNLIFRTDETAALQQLELDKINAQFSAQEAKLNLLKDEQKKKQELQLLDANRQKALQEAITKNELENQRTRQQNLKDSLSSIATLTSSSNKELFAIGKAAALATATIDGIAAVQKALASAPPPFNFVIAALVGTVQALNLSKIASQQPPSFAQGGIVPGSSFVGDNVQANVNSGELVLTRQQQANLFQQSNEGGSSGGVIAAINELGNRIAAIQTQIIINGREIARVVRDEREAGFAV